MFNFLLLANIRGKRLTEPNSPLVWSLNLSHSPLKCYVSFRFLFGVFGFECLPVRLCAFVGGFCRPCFFCCVSYSTTAVAGEGDGDCLLFLACLSGFIILLMFCFYNACVAVITMSYRGCRGYCRFGYFLCVCIRVCWGFVVPVGTLQRNEMPKIHDELTASAMRNKQLWLLG